MIFLMLAILVVLYSFQTLFCTLFNRKYTGSKEDSSAVFCVVEAPAIALVSLALNGWHFSVSATTLLLGLLNGFALFIYNTTLIEASRRGSYAFLNVAQQFGALLFPILYSVFAYGEDPSALQWGAMAVILLACWLMNRDDMRLSGTSPAYYWLCLALFCANGTYGTLLKMQSVLCENEGREMVMLTYLLMGVIAFIRLAHRKKKAVWQAFRFTGASIVPLLICLASAALAINLLVFVLPQVDAAVLYTAKNGGILLLSCVYSLVIFKEKLTPLKTAGMTLALAGMIALAFAGAA